MALPINDPSGKPNVFVPFAEIAALLQSRLSASELDDLLSRLIATRKRIVQPGDLITAEWAMDVMTRLTLLEQGGPGPSVGALNEKAATTMRDAWQAYTGLLKRGEFLPDGTTSEAIKAVAVITSAIQEIVVSASFGASRAYGTAEAGLVDLFRGLYDAQHDLIVLLNSSIPGDASGRQTFATVVNALLETTDGTGALSLRESVEKSDAAAAIKAQNRINGVVRDQSGAVVVGNIQVAYRTSTRGETLVLGDNQAFGYVFRVTNKTNRRLQVQLQAEFLPPRQAWSSSARVAGDDQTISLAPFDPLRPDDSSAFKDVQVVVVTPPGAADKEQGRLQLRAFAPPPINRAGIASVTLDVGTAAAPVQPTRIAFTAPPVLVSGSVTHAAENQLTELRFDYQFTTTVVPTSRDFRFKVKLTAPLDPTFFISFDGEQPDAGASDGQNKVSSPFTLQDQGRRSTTVQVFPLAGAKGKSIAFTASVESLADGITDVSDPITLSVPA